MRVRARNVSHTAASNAAARVKVARTTTRVRLHLPRKSDEAVEVSEWQTGRGCLYQRHPRRSLPENVPETCTMPSCSSKAMPTRIAQVASLRKTQPSSRDLGVRIKRSDVHIQALGTLRRDPPLLLIPLPPPSWSMTVCASDALTKCKDRGIVQHSVVEPPPASAPKSVKSSPAQMLGQHSMSTCKKKRLSIDVNGRNLHVAELVTAWAAQEYGQAHSVPPRAHIPAQSKFDLSAKKRDPKTRQ